MPRPSRWNEIVDAAARLFQEKGFPSTSLEDIAGEVGVWKGSLYHYIDSKEDLLLAVVREPAEKILEQIREIKTIDLPPAEKIRRVARAHARTLDDTFVYASVYLQEIAGRNRSSEWADMDREYVSTITEIMQEGIDSGDFSPHLDARLAGLAMVGAFNWMTHWYRPDGPQTAVAIADQICTMLLEGLISRSRSAN